MEGQEYIIEQYMNGRSVLDIGKELHLTKESVYRRLRAHKRWKSIKRRMAHYRANKNTPELIRLYKEGVTVKEIAKKYGVSETIVYIRLADNGIERHDGRKKERNAQIVSEYLTGKKYKAIAKDHGITISRVLCILRSVFKDKWEVAKEARKKLSK